MQEPLCPKDHIFAYVKNIDIAAFFDLEQGWSSSDFIHMQQ